ncbi:LOW QUALITY PROTEIN: hypothetical protein HID58_055176, partial [Brassica napus]
MRMRMLLFHDFIEQTLLRNNATSPVKPCNVVIVYQEPVFVIPQRYVSPQKKEWTPKPAAPLPKRFKDDEPVNVTWAAATDPASSGANSDCVVPIASTTDEKGGETVNLNVSNPKPLSPIIEESECGTLLWVMSNQSHPVWSKTWFKPLDPNPGVVVEKTRVPSKAVEAVEHSYASPVVDIGGRDFPIVDDPNITVPVPGRSPVPTGTPI